MPDAPRTLLIVEDDRLLRDLIMVSLHSLCPELDILTAGDGLEALAMIETHRPRLLLLDILLPRLNGLEVLRRLAGRSDLQMETLVISALGLREVVEQAIAAGARDFIVKPFDPRRLAEKVMGLLAPAAAE